ncbi:MAG: FtsW/RodA/SpoVE family cell cycle protein [Lachnospiraceae bacterium]|nr:FtsW/RodA/SpoVE family cell cycle protein [Clostridiales bacterium]MDY3109516.1 FtsW/RodA/SpoVE family cell cycle protein [Lachnospiraceae bacterium]
MIQNILMFCMHFTCFLSICFETGETEYLVFYAFQQVLLLVMIVLFRLLYPYGNKSFMNHVAMLLSVGFVVLTRLSYNKALKQFFIVAVSAVVAMAVPWVISKLRFLRDLKWLYALLGIGMLSVVLVLGAVTNGSKLSYSIGGITFQPSEFVKIIFVFYLAAALWKNHDLGAICLSAIFAGLHVMILVLSKDLGSALIFFAVYICLVYIASGRVRYFFAGLLCGGLAACMAYGLFDHVKVRVQAWKDPWSVIDSQGYQITQSLFAVSTGGFWGRGLFQGNPGTIPYVEEDFVFSAIAEELGIVVGICILLIALNCFVLLMKLSMEIKDKFYQLLAAGIGIVYLFQVFLTVGGGTKFIPMTGVTLPFISYGGSSILTSLILFYAAQGIFIAKKLEDIEYERKKEEFLRRRNAGRSVDRHRS